MFPFCSEGRVESIDAVRFSTVVRHSVVGNRSLNMPELVFHTALHELTHLSH